MSRLCLIFYVSLFFRFSNYGKCDVFIHDPSEVKGINYPIILVHGMGGTQVFCKRKFIQSGGRFLVWINLLYFIIPKKLFDLIALKYNAETGEYHDQDECDVDFPGWGGTEQIQQLNPKIQQSEYFAQLIKAIKQDPFYISNKTIRGAPYDFRKAPSENKKFVLKFKLLVEQTYMSARKRPVVILGHSLGAIYLLYFLQHQTWFWKQKYIKAYIPISGPFGGSVEALYAQTVGDSFGIPFINPMSLRSLQRTFNSMAFVLPDSRLWSKKEPLIITPRKNYSVYDYGLLFEDMHFPLGYIMMNKTKQEFDGLQHPKYVKTHCIYGTNLHTVKQMIFKEPNWWRSKFPDQIPLIKFENGDGMVNLRSLETCRSWPNVRIYNLSAATHETILTDKRVIKIVCEVIGAKCGSEN